MDTSLLYLDEPRLQMNPVSRGILRGGSSLFYGILTALVPAFFITDLPSLKWLGGLVLLFLIDRLIHIGRAERSFYSLSSSGARTNMASYLAPKTLTILERAYDRAMLLGGDFSLYLAKLLLENHSVREGLSRLDIPAKEFEKRIDDAMGAASGDNNQKTLSSTLHSTVALAFASAKDSGEQSIEPRNLFAALAQGTAPLNRIFNFWSVAADDLQNALILARLARERAGFLGNARRVFRRHHAARPHRIMNRAWTARPTPITDTFSDDLTDRARAGAGTLLVGHENEYKDCIRILSRPIKPNVLLIGDPGSGKETIIQYLASQIASDAVPRELFDKRVISLRLGSLISGASADEVARRVNVVTGEIVAAGNIVLYIPDIHNLVKTSGAGFLSAADILLPIIINDAFPVIGATYPKEFKEMIEPQTDFAATFEPIRVNELGEADAIRLLSYISIDLEDRYSTVISFGAIKIAVTVAHKYFRYKLLPGSAEELLKEALADATQRHDYLLQADDVVAIAERKTNVPIHRPGEEEREKLLRLEELIHERLIDQEEAVQSVSRTLREYRSGLGRKGGPIASFLFVGPTGVGKTELAKILASIQFGSETMMLRFDMSEYQDKQSFFRFIGSPDGKIAGMLTEAVIQKPYSLILLDEFEKAHPDILNLFLQVSDDGRLTDNLGRTVDFTNTIIIATSNAHSDFIKTRIEAHTPIEAIAEQLKKKLTDFFRPELLNRFSDIIVFKTLGPDDILQITELQLDSLAASVREAQGVELSFEDAAIRKVAELGYDPAFGARPLRGVISEKLRSVLAEKILKGSLVHGDIVRVSIRGDELTFITKSSQIQ
ncbi:ATP-dependent Clp protease ATP-binding subunit [Candidatus Wolfebacteria bacterium]|nr:ATP-dependent Clp protease ATP-binding subunit [Candidatus Wolfebacteria bacterium]